MSIKWSDAFLKTRAETQACIAAHAPFPDGLNYPGFTIITDAVGATLLIRVENSAQDGIAATAFDMTNGLFGYYDITADTFTPIPAVSNTGGGNITNIYTLKVPLSAAQTKTAGSIPIDIGLPSSGAGYYYRIISFDCKINYGTVPFTSTNLYISSTSQGNAIIFNACVQETAISQLYAGTLNSATTPLVLFYQDDDTISIFADSDSAVGDSTIDCYITVEKITI